MGDRKDCCCQSLTRVWLFATLWTVAHQTPLSSTVFWSLLKFMSVESVMPSNLLILCHPLLPPSIFPSIRIFSNESVLCTRWPKYWSFNFSISPSNEYSGWISFRIDWFDLLVVSRIFQQALSFTSCVTLGELPYLSRTQFPPLLNRLHVSQNLVVGEG